jgi:hypothetical protein
MAVPLSSIKKDCAIIFQLESSKQLRRWLKIESSTSSSKGYSLKRQVGKKTNMGMGS